MPTVPLDPRSAMPTSAPDDRGYELHSDPQHTGPHYVRRATGFSLSLIEKLIASRIRVAGVEHVPAEGPVLFLCNHFTRFETFILPWLLDRHTGRYVCNLAHHALFAGRFGDYLTSIGARSTREPGIKETITHDLLTGRHDWVIYPEGSMIKDKRIWNRGRLELGAPDRRGPPHTGSALMALQAALTRRRYLDAWRSGDRRVLDEIEDAQRITGANLPRTGLTIVPITITYYPIRPGDNLAVRLARRLLKQVPDQLGEELAVEGNLLLGDTDISVYFGEGIPVDPWVEPLVAVQGGAGFEAALTRAKDELTTTVMSAIYRHVTVNLDHLFACALRYAPFARVRREDLHRAIYLAARSMQSHGGRTSHRTLGEELLALVTGAPSPALASVVALAEREGLLTVDSDWYQLNREAIHAGHAFHDVRLKNTLAVIANELEPLRPAVRAMRAAMHLPRERLRSRTADLLQREDLAEYRRDRGQVDMPPLEEVGAPFRVGAGPVSVVACHGYLAAPGEMRDLANHLAREGFGVFGTRLSGHGTGPLQLARTRRDDWRRSVDRSLAAARCAGERTVLVGFSMGGLLCLDAAARLPQAVDGVVAINLPLRLRDPASRLVPAVDLWNNVAHALHADRLRFASVLNSPEWPDTNYRRNPVAGIHELERLIGESWRFLPKVRCPVLLLQADADPVIDPAGADDALALIGSGEKRLQRLAFRRHVVVRGDGSAAVHLQIADFLAELRRGW